MDCEHKTIVLANAVGKKPESGGYEVDFLVRCGDCETEFFRTNEYKKEIINISKICSGD
ncbi:hypothetical protein [Lysinibacillus agricola]|uniref:hypothetical protein n=1 Tax=Lysinibacillus agricola TaxID=2590012 RepID=UPI003C1E183B